MCSEKIAGWGSSPEEYFMKCYLGFWDCDWLSMDEKVIFLSLKRFLDVRSNSGKVFPSIATIQKITGWGNQKVIKNIKRLVKKGLVKCIRRGFGKSNVYILSDNPEMWACDNANETEAAEDNKREKSLTAEEHIAELKKMGHKVKIEKEEEELEVKEKEVIKKEPVPVSWGATDTSSKTKPLDNHTTDESESQEGNSTSKADADALLDRLWPLYPVKKGKWRISAAQKKKLLKIGYDEMARAIERYKQYVESVDYLNYQNGSTFFNGGYLDYLDANYDPESEREARNNQAKSSQAKSSQKKNTQKKNTFNDYPHREYDFDAIKRGMFDQ